MDSCPREASGKSGQNRQVLTCRRDVHFPPVPGENPCHAFPFPFLKRSRRERAPPSATGGASPSSRTCPSSPPCLAWEGARGPAGGYAAPQPHARVSLPHAAPTIRGARAEGAERRYWGAGAGSQWAPRTETPAGEGGEGGGGRQGRRTMMSRGRYRDGE